MKKWLKIWAPIWIICAAIGFLTGWLSEGRKLKKLERKRDELQRKISEYEN